MRRAFTLVLLLIPLTAGAQSTFYDAYDLGLERLREGRWGEAREAFLTAARLHEDPEKRVRTYGLNTIQNYDPYLYLARAEIELGMLDDAESHLARSDAAGVSDAVEISGLRKRIAQLRRAAAPTPSPVPPTPTTVPTAEPTASPTPVTEASIDSRPRGAEVYLDNRYKGVTPVRFEVEPGLLRIDVRMTGYQPFSEEIAARAGQSFDRVIDLMPDVVPSPTRRQTAPIATPATVVVQPSPTAVIPPTPTEVPPTAVPAETIPVAEESNGMDPMIRVILGVAVLLIGAAAIAAGLFLKGDRASRSLVDTLTPTRRMAPETVNLAHATPLPDTIKPRFGDYRLSMVLGRGGMATTYLAERTRDKVMVAIKIPHEHLLDEPEFVDRFVREGSLGATIHHPNIVRIFDAGTVGNRPFIAMELLDGMTLEQLLAADGALGVRSALEIARGVGLALDYAHVKGIVHRDLKPENVMVLPDSSIKVMDFGIARIKDAPGLTATNAYIGTPLYSAPECLKPAEVDARSDLYTLGIIMYRMLTNRLPFEAASPIELLRQHRDEPLPNFPRELAVPTRVEEMVRRLAAKNKDDRYPSAESFLHDLNQLLNQM